MVGVESACSFMFKDSVKDNVLLITFQGFRLMLLSSMSGTGIIYEWILILRIVGGGSRKPFVLSLHVAFVEGCLVFLRIQHYFSILIDFEMMK